MRKVILVTGGAGYIGSHTCKALYAAGYMPVTYDSLVRGNKWAVQWGPLEIGDIADQALLSEVCQKYKPIAVIHFAAYAYVGESVTEPRIYYHNNTAGTISLLNTLLDHGINNIVFSSTCATYGIPTKMPINEQTAQNPVNPYGRSKLMIEHILKDYADAFGLNSVALRYFNAAGADPEGQIGEAHEPETHLIPLILEAAKSQSDPLTVFGNDHPTRDGTCIRDYIHVNDLADAHIRALTLMDNENGFHAINLGTGYGHSILEVIAAAEKITGHKVPYVMGPRRAGDPPELVADASFAKAKMGWVPKLSDIDTISQTAWNWMKSQ